MVVFRENAKRRRDIFKYQGDALFGQPPDGWKDKIYTIIQPNIEPVTSAAKGSKKYAILPFGHSQIIITEERFVKKYKNNN